MELFVFRSRGAIKILQFWKFHRICMIVVFFAVMKLMLTGFAHTEPSRSELQALAWNLCAIDLLSGDGERDLRFGGDFLGVFFFFVPRGGGQGR